MRLSVRLSKDDIEFLGDYASRHGLASRSAVVRRAIGLLRASRLGPAYAEAWASWEAEDGAPWETAVADGLTRS